jgi:hypothetical protein
MSAMDAKTIGRAIGAMSLTFGITDILLGKRFARGTGMSEARGGTLFRTVGVREVATGLAGLAWPASSAPIWTRLAADVGDLAILGAVAARASPKRSMALLAVGIVAAVALVDLAAARAQASGPRSS